MPTVLSDVVEIMVIRCVPVLVCLLLAVACRAERTKADAATVYEQSGVVYLALGTETW